MAHKTNAPGYQRKGGKKGKKKVPPRMMKKGMDGGMRRTMRVNV